MKRLSNATCRRRDPAKKRWLLDGQGYYVNPLQHSEGHSGYRWVPRRNVKSCCVVEALVVVVCVEMPPIPAADDGAMEETRRGTEKANVDCYLIIRSEIPRDYQIISVTPCDFGPVTSTAKSPLGALQTLGLRLPPTVTGHSSRTTTLPCTTTNHQTSYGWKQL